MPWPSMVARSKRGIITFSLNPTFDMGATAGSRSGAFLTRTSRCSATSFRVVCGRPSTSLRTCCVTSPTSSRTPFMPIRRASRFRCSDSRLYLGFDLLPRIRNWQDLNFYRPSATAEYQHVDGLFGDNVIDWRLTETHFPDLLRTAISIREGRLSSVTLLRRLGNNSRKNRLYPSVSRIGARDPHDHVSSLSVRPWAARADHRYRQHSRGVPWIVHVVGFRWRNDRPKRP